VINERGPTTEHETQYYVFLLLPNVKVGWIAILLLLRKVLGSHLEPQTDPPDYGFFWHGILQSFQGNSKTVLNARP
jgi:hypothetical protein